MYKWKFERQEIRSCILGACESIFQNKRIAEEVYDCIMEDVEDFLSDHLDGWIPCSERLPEVDGHYLCTVTKPQYIDRIYVHFIYWCGRWYGWIPEEVIAWMPLPEPYHSGEATEMVKDEPQTERGSE